MKRNILYLLFAGLLFSCAVKKPEKRTGFMKGFYTKYNTLFNAEDALNTEFETRSEAHKDNFYAPYINILTYEEQPLGSELGQTVAFKDPNPNINVASENKDSRKGFNNSPDVSENSGLETKGATILEIAEAKALKAIDKYSVTRKGKEENKKIFDAYMVLAQSRIYMGKPLQALDALNYVFTYMKDDKRVPLAKIYQGLAYTKSGDIFKGNEIFSNLKKQKLDKDYEKLLSIYYAESLLDSDKKDLAVQELNNAFELNKNRKLKSRIAFLRGQVLLSQGKNELARESYLNAYKYANDFEFEVKSQIEIAKTYNGKGGYDGAKKYLEDISKKGTYASRKNEFYYALGLMANKAGKKDEAKEYFRKSLKEKVSDPQIRGLSYYEIGRGYFDENEHIAAGAYYDSAIAVMTYAPTKTLLEEQSANIKMLAKNYYLIKKNDSILALSKMNEAQKTAYFAKYIEKIKAQEEAIEREKRREERSRGFDTGDYNANSIFSSSNNSFQDFGTGTKGFYFANNNTVAKGSTEFKQTWGNRALSDNWRYSKTMASIGDAKNQALGITATVQNPRRFEPSFYIEKIPKDANTLANLKKDRDTAALGMGIMYDDYFSNRPLSTKTLYDLVDNSPEEKVMLRALYEIFSMNYESNPQLAARAKEILLRDYPYTSYAEFARNPKAGNFAKSTAEAENAYKTAFALYTNERFDESKTLIDQSLQQYSKDALVPKFALLNAFNSGKTSGKEVMILQLEQIALNYKDTAEGEKAKEMLNWLKSDLKIQMRDDKGNIIPQNQNKPNPSTNKQNTGILNLPTRNNIKEMERNKAMEEQQKNVLDAPKAPGQTKRN